MTLGDLKSIATIIGAIIAVLTFLKGMIEYIKQGSQKRAEHFNIMRIKFKENAVFKEICDLLECDDEKLTSIKFADKRDFLGFFEEIALMMNSKIIKKEVAHYMFGYYAIRCWKSRKFWTNVNKESNYWQLFNKFVTIMLEIQEKFKFKNSNYKF
jgi:hypothetical protein